MKSASEILQKHRQPLNDMGEDMVYYSHAIQAMNEFADQFKNPSPASPVPVKEEYNMPDSFCTGKKFMDNYSAINSSAPTEEQKNKYPIGGFAPGAYTCTYIQCKKQFQGDKRAFQCEPCAIKNLEAYNATFLKPEEQDKEVKDEFSTIDFRERAKDIYKKYLPNIEPYQKTLQNMFLLGCEAGLLTPLPIKKINTMNVHLIESHEPNGIEWGVSFTDNNPEVKDFFPMDKETAIRLYQYLSAPPLPLGELNKMAEERAVEMYKYQDGPDHSWDAMQNQRRQGFKDGFIAGYTARTTN